MRILSPVTDATQKAPGTVQLLKFSPRGTRKLYKCISIWSWVRCLGHLEEISCKENGVR